MAGNWPSFLQGSNPLFDSAFRVAYFVSHIFLNLHILVSGCSLVGTACSCRDLERHRYAVQSCFLFIWSGGGYYLPVVYKDIWVSWTLKEAAFFRTTY